jgi:hypothetical protein
MGASVIPATGAGSDNWVQISSITPTAASSSVSFTSISGYRKLLLRTNGLTLTGSGSTNLIFNSDTGANYTYGSPQWDNTSYSNVYTSAGTSINLFAGTGGIGTTATFIIDSVSTNGIKTFTFFGYGQSTASTNVFANAQGLYLASSAITSITLRASGTTFNAAGTLTLYGVAA